ncbi:hypothetical protein FHX37_0161 [Haloactinospora alba]|uniref:Terpene synthase n=1 Tax=Haloactinospora alba TaxID=405555 RepID=A0A543NEV6_9ACTN|nr:terpene synthase family protein [Haloactinospora alba]TQN30290.1 hypothetical protein FHX37_0161 [Haloactinospora alba]
MSVQPDRTIQYELPRLECGPWAVNPHYDDEYQAAMDEWCFPFFEGASWMSGRTDYYRESKLHLGIALIYPEADRERLDTWVKWNGLLCLCDDAVETAWARNDGATGTSVTIWDRINAMIARGREAGASPWELTDDALLAKIVELTFEIRSWLPSDAGEQFLDTVRDGFQSMTRKDQHRAAMPSLIDMTMAEYLRYRDTTYFTDIFFLGAAPMSGLEVPSGFFRDPALQRALAPAARHLFLMNDLYSFRREYVYHQENLTSLVHPVTLRVFNEGYSWQEAIDDLVAMITTAGKEYAAARDEWVATTDFPQADRYARALDLLLGGNHRFHQVSRRYHLDGETADSVVCDPEHIGYF